MSIPAEQQAAAAKCVELWEKAAKYVSAKHGFLISARVRAYGLRQLRDMLLVPLRDPTGALANLQFIKPDGGARFKTGGRIQGCYHAIGPLTDRLYICEGYAPAATIHEATGCGVVVAFTADNLEVVTQIVEAKHPGRKLVIAPGNATREKLLGVEV